MIFGRAGTVRVAEDVPAWLVALVVDGRRPRPGEEGHGEFGAAVYLSKLPASSPALVPGVDDLLAAHRPALLEALRVRYPRASASSLERRLGEVAAHPLADVEAL